MALDISSDGSIVIGCSLKLLIAFNTVTGAVLWQKNLLGNVGALRLHKGVVVVPIDSSNTVVLDVATGNKLYALP